MELIKWIHYHNFYTHESNIIYMSSVFVKIKNMVSINLLLFMTSNSDY